MAAATAVARPLRVIAGADSFGCTLKDALVAHLRSLNIEVEDLPNDAYYCVAAEVGRRVSVGNAATASSPTPKVRGLLVCGTGVGVAIFANKFPGVYASTCNTVGEAINNRSLNNCNVLTVGSNTTSPQAGIEILEAWLNTPFKAPCPASNFKPWNEEVSNFLENSLKVIPKIGLEEKPSKKY